jgi:hypothetical protein
MAEETSRRRADVGVAHSDDAVTLTVGAEKVTLGVDEAEELARRVVDAAARASGQSPEENDWVRLPMQYVRVAAERVDFEVEPTGTDVRPIDEVPDTGDAKTAEVHCWIRDQTQQNAMHVVAGWIASHGWAVTDVIEQAAVTRDDFEGTEYLPYYEQALMDSEVFLYEISDAETDETEGSADAS